MSDFFEPPPAPGPAPEREPQPAWWSAPSGALPGVIALDLLLARTDRAAIAVTRLGAYPSGFEFDLTVLMADDEDDLDPDMFGHHLRRRRGRGPVPDGESLDRLRFGIQFADGAKATNLEPFEFPREQPARPSLRPGGGGGGDGEWRQRIWIWPLPPPGPLSFVCEWPAAGIKLTRKEIDAQLVVDAATRSRQLFERRSGGGGTIVGIVRSRD